MKTYELNGVVKRVPTGFSWTTLFFGFFPALLRGDLKWAAIQALGNGGIIFMTGGIGLLVTWPLFAAIYNSRYEQDLRVAGWKERTTG